MAFFPTKRQIPPGRGPVNKEKQDLKEEVGELKKELGEAKKEVKELEDINEGLFNDYYSDKSDLAKHYKHLVQTYFSNA